MTKLARRLAMIIAAAFLVSAVQASSHREAPLARTDRAGSWQRDRACTLEMESAFDAGTIGLTGVSEMYTLTHMNMVKTQVYLPRKELDALHRIARRRKRAVAELVREAVRAVWLRPERRGPVALWDGPFAGTASDHEGAFDEP